MAVELFEAIEQRNMDRLAALLEAGVDPNEAQQGGPGYTPLQAAINELEDGGSIEALILLLRHGAKVDGWDPDKEVTPLLMALFRRQGEAVRILLAAGADTNVRGAEGDSPLRWCVEKRDHETAALLLRCGASRTIEDSGGPSGMTALGRAAYNLDVPMVELLLAAGADPEALDVDLQTAREHMPEPPVDEEGRRAWARIQELLAAGCR